MRFLLTNDDGVFSKGIYEMALALSDVGEVVVFAPNMQKSACSHSITMTVPLRVKQVSLNEKFKSYSVSGTPADCVKVALESGLIEMPDIIVSGINHGSNLATDILYSGTVGGAMEGSLYDIRSFAVSLNADESSENYKDAAMIARDIILKDFSSLPNSTVININIPDKKLNEILGIKVARQGKAVYQNALSKHIHPSGAEYYWLAGKLENDFEDETDIKFVHEDYVVVMPIKSDLTDYSSMDSIKKIFDI